jgi:predicted MFS family arabinose efflux permease
VRLLVRSVLSMVTAVRQPAERIERPPLLSRPLLVRFISIAGVSVSFYLMLSVVPLFARSAGASTNVAGLTTTVLSLSTIAGYLPTPRLVARYGHRAVLAAGLLLLGAPALVLAVTANLTVVLVACAVRGIGFAITCVSGGALTVSLIPPERRGEGLALIGVVSGVPSLAALPAGVWFSGHAGFRAVFVVAALAALAPVASLPWLPGSAGDVRSRPPAGSGPGAEDAGGAKGPAAASDSMLAGLRSPALLRPALVFFSVTMATGIFVTFVPLAAPRADAGAAALALFIQPAAAIGGRWVAGRVGDRAASGRLGPHGLLVPGVLIAAAGIALLSLPGRALVPLMIGALLFGAGFGVTQNVSLTLMYDLVPESGFSMVSAVWNLAYDSGMGIGAAWFGAVAGGTGYPVAFGITALVMVIAAGLHQGRKSISRDKNHRQLWTNGYRIRGIANCG